MFSNKQPATESFQNPLAPSRSQLTSTWSGSYTLPPPDTRASLHSERHFPSLLQQRVHRQHMFGPTMQQLGKIADAWCRPDAPRLTSMACSPFGEFSLPPSSALQQETAGADGCTPHLDSESFLSCMPILSASHLLTRLNGPQSSTQGSHGSFSSRTPAGECCAPQLDDVVNSEYADMSQIEHAMRPNNLSDSPDLPTAGQQQAEPFPALSSSMSSCQETSRLVASEIAQNQTANDLSLWHILGTL